MTRNSTTNVSLENEKSIPKKSIVPRPTHKALISAMSSAAT